MSVAFVILNWNEPNRTKIAIEALKESELRTNSSSIFIVVDNGSDSETKRALVDYFQSNGWNVISESDLFHVSKKTHTLILNNGNYGYARGNNIGLKFAKNLGFKYSVVMNNDVLVTEPVTPVLLSILQRARDAAVVGPRVVGLDGKEQGPFWKDGMLEYFLLPVFYPIFYPFWKIKNILFSKYILKSCHTRGYAEVYRLMGCFMLIDLDKMEEVGWFDEGTFLYAEEPILSEKLLTKGYKTLYTNSVTVVHEHEVSTKSSLGDKRWKLQLTSDLYYLKKYRHYGPIRLFLVKVGRYVGVKFQGPLVKKMKQLIIRAFKKER